MRRGSPPASGPSLRRGCDLRRPRPRCALPPPAASRASRTASFEAHAALDAMAPEKIRRRHAAASSGLQLFDDERTRAARHLQALYVDDRAGRAGAAFNAGTPDLQRLALKARSRAGCRPKRTHRAFEFGSALLPLQPRFGL